MFVFHRVCHAKIKACVDNGLNGLELIAEWQGITSLGFRLGFLRNPKAGKLHPSSVRTIKVGRGLMLAGVKR